MKLSEIYSVLDAVAPKRLSDEWCRRYGGYDNSGILADSGEEVVGALYSLDFSAAAVDRATELGANLIVTHHPAIYAKIGNILQDNPAGRTLQRALRSGISVISMHLNLDCATHGIDDCLMRGIGGERVIGMLEPLDETGCGYGRVYDVSPCTAAQIAERIGLFPAKKVLCYGEDRAVRRVASFCGAGASENAVAWAAEQGADCIVSSDFKHHIVAMALEYGLAVVVPTHYAAENYGFHRFYQETKEKIGVESEYFRDDRLL